MSAIRRGATFGRLVALRPSSPKRAMRAVKIRTWLCRCTCGRQVVVTETQLTRRQRGTRSCGCLKTESALQRCRENRKKSEND